MTPRQDDGILRLGLPKGRMQQGVFVLLGDAGITVRLGGRGYRPQLSIADIDTKLLKPQNVIEMLHAGSRDIGFAGRDWVEELNVDLVELLDTGLDPVRIVAAAPASLAASGAWRTMPLVIASEYEHLARSWIVSNDLNATFVRSYGATEVFPPEDADIIIDNTATGSTLSENRLSIVDEIARSSTRLFANARVMDDPAKRERIEHLVLLLRSVLEARSRVMIEVNVTRGQLDAVVATIPCMREPTIAPLRGEAGYAVKAAVPRCDLPHVIPAIKQQGGSDIVVSELSQIVP